MITLQKPDITDTLKTEGIELRQRGKSLWACCPFHTEKTASFKVDPKKQSFHAFCCQEHGDVITFIQKYKGLSFKDALSYLGIKGNGKHIKHNPEKTRERELIQEYRQWEINYADFLCDVLRMLDRAKMKATTMKRVEAMAYHYHMEQIWEYHFEILLDKDEKEKFELYKEMRYGK